MNAENTKKLTTEFPNVYPSFDPLYPTGPNNNEFHFSCGDGWFQLLYDLSARLEPLCAKEKGSALMNKVLHGDMDNYCYAVQVKEKLGTLRFYMTYSTPEISYLISKAEDLSGKTCEQCGAAGHVREGRWIKTLCDEHSAERAALNR